MSNKKILVGGILMSPAQRDALDFIWEFISATGLSPMPGNFVEASISNHWEKIKRLKMRGLLRFDRHDVAWSAGHGKALLITYVRHPIKGEIFTDAASDLSNGEARHRRCLCCTGKFLSAHKFNRLCPTCSADASQYSSSDAEGGYICNGLGIFSGVVGGVFIRKTHH